MAEPWLEFRLVQSQSHPASCQSALSYLVYTPICSPSVKCPEKGTISPEGSECAMAKRSRPWKKGDFGCPLGRVGRLLYQRREALMQTGAASFTLSLSCGCFPCAMQPLLPAQGTSFLFRISPLPGVCRWLVLISWSHLVDEANINA